MTSPVFTGSFLQRQVLSLKASYQADKVEGAGTFEDRIRQLATRLAKFDQTASLESEKLLTPEEKLTIDRASLLRTNTRDQMTMDRIMLDAGINKQTRTWYIAQTANRTVILNPSSGHDKDIQTVAEEAKEKGVLNKHEFYPAQWLNIQGHKQGRKMKGFLAQFIPKGLERDTALKVIPFIRVNEPEESQAGNIIASLFPKMNSKAVEAVVANVCVAEVVGFFTGETKAVY